jgi:arsenate reductase
MTTPLVTADLVTDIRRIAQVMLEHGVDGVPIANESDALVGFVSRSDVLRAVITDPPLSLWRWRMQPAPATASRTTLPRSQRMSQTPVRIYHNRRCSKSRAACQLVAQSGVPAEIIDYLETPPKRDELRLLLRQLGLPAAGLVRRGEAVFREFYAGRTLSEDEWLDALVAHPILIERPIVVRGERAVVGRPPEKVLELLQAD